MIVIDTNIVLDLFVFKDPLAQPLAQALANQTYQWIATAPMRDAMLDFDQLNALIGTPELLALGQTYAEG